MVPCDRAALNLPAWQVKGPASWCKGTMMGRGLLWGFGLVLVCLAGIAGWFAIQPGANPDQTPPVPQETNGSSPAPLESQPDLAAPHIDQDPPGEETIIYLVADRTSFRPASLAEELMLALAKGEPAQIRVDTYTDTLLAAADSRAMTALWAAEMRELLVLLGVDPLRIKVTAHGEDNLAVQTGDRVNSAENPRVVLTVLNE